MISVIASSTVNRGVDPRSDQRDRPEYCKSWGRPPVWSAWSPRVYCKPWGRPPVWSKTIKKSLKIPKGVIRSHKSKDRQYNGQKGKDKRTNNDLQNTTQKTKCWTPLKTDGELRKCNQFLLYQWHPPWSSCYYKPGNRSWMRKGHVALRSKNKTCWLCRVRVMTPYA